MKSFCFSTFPILEYSHAAEHRIIGDLGSSETAFSISSIDSSYLPLSLCQMDSQWWGEGKFGFSLEEIPGDSFLIAITGEDYFEENEWISTPNKSTEKKFILEKRVTVITGYVLDESTDGIYDCEITTMPSITKKVPPTDKKGKFVIKSDEFNEGVSYHIFARNPPDYIQNSTNITPNINQRNWLPSPIYLEKVSDKVDKGNLTQWRYRIGDITDTYYAGEKYEMLI